MILEMLIEDFEKHNINYSLGHSFVMGLIEKRSIIISIGQFVNVNLSVSFQSDFGDVEFFVKVNNNDLVNQLEKSNIKSINQFKKFIDFLSNGKFISENYKWNIEDDMSFALQVLGESITFQYLVCTCAEEINDVIMNFLNLLKNIT